MVVFTGMSARLACRLGVVPGAAQVLGACRRLSHTRSGILGAHLPEGGDGRVVAMQQRGAKGLAPSQRKALNLQMKSGMDKATDDKDAITNELIILNPPSRPTPEWMKSPETKKKVLKQRRDFHKSWARYMMHNELLLLKKKHDMHARIDVALNELKHLDKDLWEAANEPHEEVWSKEFIADYKPDTPAINGYNPVTREVDPKLIKPKPTYT